MNLNNKDTLEKIKVISLVIIAISSAIIAYQFSDIIALLSLMVN